MFIHTTINIEWWQNDTVVAELMGGCDGRFVNIALVSNPRRVVSCHTPPCRVPQRQSTACRPHARRIARNPHCEVQADRKALHFGCFHEFHFEPRELSTHDAATNSRVYVKRSRTLGTQKEFISNATVTMRDIPVSASPCVRGFGLERSQPHVNTPPLTYLHTTRSAVLECRGAFTSRGVGLLGHERSAFRMRWLLAFWRNSESALAVLLVL